MKDHLNELNLANARWYGDKTKYILYNILHNYINSPDNINYGNLE